MFNKVVTNKNKINSIRHLKVNLNWLFGISWVSDIFPEANQILKTEMPADINQ
jgi:hypothetical protein